CAHCDRDHVAGVKLHRHVMADAIPIDILRDISRNALPRGAPVACARLSSTSRPIAFATAARPDECLLSFGHLKSDHRPTPFAAEIDEVDCADGHAKGVSWRSTSLAGCRIRGSVSMSSIQTTPGRRHGEPNNKWARSRRGAFARMVVSARDTFA